jgi:hypothetical protein
MIVAQQKFLKEVFDDFLLGVMLDHNTLSLKKSLFFYNLLFLIHSKRLLRRFAPRNDKCLNLLILNFEFSFCILRFAS